MTVQSFEVTDTSSEISENASSTLMGEHGECSGFWIPFEATASPRLPRVEVLESDGQSCVVAVTTLGMYEEQVKMAEKTFEKLIIPGYGSTNELGRPQLPVIRGFMEIPGGKDVSVKVTAIDSLELLSHGTVYPVQPQDFSYAEAEYTTFEFDESFYLKDTYYPDRVVSVSSAIQLRDHTLVQLSVYPIRLNPVADLLNVSTSIRIKLQYHDSSNTSITTRRKLSSHVFDGVLKDSIWNYDSYTCETSAEESAGYLVISGDPFYYSLYSFVNWKTANGLTVTLTRVSDIAADATDEDIHNYIRNAFFNWSLPPTYVLLVGDVEFIPTHYGLNGVEGPEPEKIPSDNYYACVCGDDLFPDLFVGRLSVKNVSELNAIVDKIINYGVFFNEQATVISALTAVEPDASSEWIYDVLMSEGYIVDHLYGENVTTSAITEAVNEGRTIINYGTHGFEDEWAGVFQNHDVLELNNAGKYPIVLSFSCLTGRFDYTGGDCLGETWMKAPGKGAVAFWGSTKTSEGPFNDVLSKGCYKAMFDEGLNEFGPITVRAKLWMYNMLGEIYDQLGKPHTSIHIELYNILTDPQLLVTSGPQSPRIYIRADGSVEPSTSHISSTDNMTYIFTGNINDSIIIEKNNITIDGNGYTLQGHGKGTGFISSNTTGVTVRNTNITGFAKGIYLDSTSYANLSANSITDNYFGIWLDYSSNNTISENMIANNKVGIKLACSLNVYVTLLKPEIRSYNNSVFGNDISNNEIGIRIFDRALALENSRISENEISNNEIGMQVDGGKATVVSQNNIAANSLYGVLATYGRYNRFFHNSFINNTENAYSEESTRTYWDNGYPCGGNYWSDYSNSDGDGDGIGDTPYTINISTPLFINQDNYPLINPVVHDVAILSVKLSHRIVARPSNVSISTKIKNYGCIFAETFNVTIYANTTTIETLMVTNLAPLTTQVINFTWKVPAGFTEGEYFIEATATTVAGETKISDNTYTDGEAFIFWPRCHGWKRQWRFFTGELP